MWLITSSLSYRKEIELQQQINDRTCRISDVKCLSFIAKNMIFSHRVISLVFGRGLSLQIFLQYHFIISMSFLKCTRIGKWSGCGSASLMGVTSLALFPDGRQPVCHCGLCVTSCLRFLFLSGGRVKTWKRRWFILTDNCLYYFEYTTVSVTPRWPFDQ